jgi:hypothetical protein
MVNIEMEILGDPYFLADSGINSNYFSPKGINSQVTGDNSLNYEGSDIFIYIAFRTPVEPNLSVSGEGGLYEFPNGGKESPYSGIYKVISLENSFSSGKFTQKLKLIRPPGQKNDLVGQEAIVKGNLALYGQLFSKPPASTPAADTSVNDEQGNLSSLDRLLGTLSSTVDSVGNIAASVASGNISGILGSVGGILNSVAGSNEAAQANLRPSSQGASAAPQTTNSSAQRSPSSGFVGGLFDSGVPESARAVRFNNPAPRPAADDFSFSTQAILNERAVNARRAAAASVAAQANSRAPVVLTSIDRQQIAQGNREIAEADLANQQLLPRR